MRIEVLLENPLLQVVQPAFGAERGDNAGDDADEGKLDQQRGEDQAATGAECAQDRVFVKPLI